MRGPGHPHGNLPAQQPFRFDPLRGSPLKDASGDSSSNHQPSPHQPPEAKNAIDIGETKGIHHLGSPHLPWIMGLRVIGVHYPQLPQCCLGLTGQMDPNIPKEVDGTERMGLA